jgi:hypothetical protein
VRPSAGATGVGVGTKLTLCGACPDVHVFEPRKVVRRQEVLDEGLYTVVTKAPFVVVNRVVSSPFESNHWWRIPSTRRTGGSSPPGRALPGVQSSELSQTRLPMWREPTMWPMTRSLRISMRG